MGMPLPGAQRGQDLWEVSPSPCGPRPKYETAEALRERCEAYLKWNRENPLIEAKLVSYKGRSVLEEVPKMRAMTISALTQFLGVSYAMWREWHKSRPDLAETMEWIEREIFYQKLTGAAADLLNARIISRELGLADVKDHRSSDRTMSPKDNMTADEVEQELKKRGVPIPPID